MACVNDALTVTRSRDNCFKRDQSLTQMADTAPVGTVTTLIAQNDAIMAALVRQADKANSHADHLVQVHEDAAKCMDGANDSLKQVNQAQKNEHVAIMKAKDLEYEVKELRQRLEHGGEKTTTKRAREGDSVQRHSNGRTYDGKTLWPVDATAEYKKRKVQHVLSHGEGINTVGYKKCLDVLLTDPSDIAFYVDEMPRLNVARLNQLNAILAEQRLAPGS